jgi:uroporphyrinogen-III decarboxylase
MVILMNIEPKYYKFQEGFKWVTDAAHGIPKRVPIYAQLCEMIPKEMGKRAREVFQDPELLNIGTFTVCEKYGIDVPTVSFDSYNIEAEAIGQKINFHDDIMPDIDRRYPLIQQESDIVKIVTPDFDKAGRCPFVVDVYTVFEKLTGVKASPEFCAPFTLAANLRGIETLVMDMCLNPEFAHELMTRVTEELLIPWLEYLKGKFPQAPALVGSDALASLPIVNIKFMNEFIAPYIERLREVCGSTVNVSNWTGESYAKNPEEVMDIRLRCNPGFVKGQDPDLEFLGPEFYKAYAEKHDVPLVLGVGAVFLRTSSPEEIFDRVKHYVEVGGKNGRLFFYLCNIEPGTPRENIKAAVDAVHKYGTYERCITPMKN